MIKVLFVCMGNICRSPMAEGIFQRLVRQNELEHQFEIDSAGVIGYHSGDLPDPRMRQTAEQHGIRLVSRSRKFKKKDFSEFDYILVMDDDNLANIQSLESRNKSSDSYQLFKMREFDNDKSGEDVFDPYYDTIQGFERCYQVLNESCQNFLAYVIAKHEL